MAPNDATQNDETPDYATDNNASPNNASPNNASPNNASPDTCPVLLHVGYHKAGSTWLQQALFAEPSLAFTLPFDRAEVNERLVAPKQLLYDETDERPFFAERCARASGRVPVISNERLSGNPHSGGWDSAILADRLASLFPEARILLVIREQRSAIRSVYFQYVREGGTESLARYLSPPAAGSYRRPLFDLEFFAYHRLIERYQQLFGPERVLVLPYEQLAKDPHAFAREICAFAGIASPAALPERRPNVAMSPLAATLKRPLNRWFVRDTLNPSAPLASERANPWLRSALDALDRRLPERWKNAGARGTQRRIAQATRGRYAPSNRQTADLARLDLSAWGYEV